MKFKYACYITEKEGLYQPVLSTIMESDEGEGGDSPLYSVGSGQKTKDLSEAQDFLTENAPPEASMFLNPIEEKGEEDIYWLSEFKNN